MKVGIIIVTFNSQKDIVRLLESIVVQQYKDFIVYLVDNNSKDQTLNIVQKYIAKITICIIPTMTNNGFAKGNNIGIQRAMDEGCDYVFILNPDMQLGNECVDILIDRINSDEKIAVTGLELVTNKKENTAKIKMTIEISGINPLSSILNKISKLPNILEIYRTDLRST